jgi:hypothetical protein
LACQFPGPIPVCEKKLKEKLPIMSFSYPSASMEKEHWFIVHVAAKQRTTSS